jgi:uncharacterized protein (TIGR00369 family)
MDQRHYGLVKRESLLDESGLEFIQGMIAGRHPHPPICEIMDFHFVAVEPGYVRLEALPELRHYNPIGTVHDGFAATILDTASGAAIFSALGKGDRWTTLELKLNFVRAMTHETGPVVAEGSVIHGGRTVATAEGHLKDSSGRLYAHATTTCMIFPAKNA